MKRSISLNGEWRMKPLGEDEWLNARVPGSVYTDLLAAGRMEDPFYRDNEYAAFDLMEKDYVYEKTFHLSEEESRSPSLDLVFAGLDTVAEVTLNRRLLFRADNMHRTWRTDIRPFAKAGENVLRVLFYSPNRAAREAFAENHAAGSSDALDGFTSIRKAHCMYGWDWGPRLPDAGIWRDIALEIVYQDEDLAVVYKPSGMVVHPAAGNESGTMVNALLARLDNLSGIGGEIRPGIVHRIDKDTSGLLLVAKNDFAHVALSEQIRAHTVKRAYRAIVIGGFREAEGTVDGPIGRHPADRKKMAIVPGGREAVTHWTALERLRGATLIEARLTTGRTHQIRVHMASIGHPVLGDPVYGPKKSPYPVTGGQLLHAFRLGFVHPRTGEEMLFEAEPEARFTRWLEKLRQ